MSFTPADPLSLICFWIVIAGVLFATILATPPIIRNKVIISLSLWLLFFALFSLSGLPEEKPVPFLGLFFGLANLGALVFGLSPWGKRIAFTVPIAALVLFQFFRLPLELILHSWALQGTVPESMTWTGQNFDIISGVLALLLAPLTFVWTMGAWIVNVVGFLLLLNVMRVAITTPNLQLPFHFPYCWIVPVCIGGALAGHVLLTRALLHKKDIERNQ